MSLADAVQKRRKQFSLLYQCLEDLVELDNNEDAVEDSVETEKRKSKRGRNDDDEDEEDEDEDDKEAKDDRMLDWKLSRAQELVDTIKILLFFRLQAVISIAGKISRPINALNWVPGWSALPLPIHYPNPP